MGLPHRPGCLTKLEPDVQEKSRILSCPLTGVASCFHRENLSKIWSGFRKGHRSHQHRNSPHPRGHGFALAAQEEVEVGRGASRGSPLLAWWILRRGLGWTTESPGSFIAVLGLLQQSTTNNVYCLMLEA
jgi:hypothetical protein